MESHSCDYVMLYKTPASSSHSPINLEEASSCIVSYLWRRPSGGEQGAASKSCGHPMADGLQEPEVF